MAKRSITISNHLSIKQIESHLTKKQLVFCKLYATNNNISQSSKQANIPYVSAYSALRENPYVEMYCNMLRQQMIDEYNLKIEYCVMQMKKTIEMALEKKDYKTAAEITQKLSKIQPPITNPTTDVIITIN